MIKVQVKRRSAANRSIVSFRVTGHAQYDEPGKDIVCSAVSAVTVGTVNAIEALTSVVPVSKVRSGLLDVRIPDKGISETVGERIQLLLEGMVVMLNSIEETYGTYISIQISYSEGG
jgi:uncharacterized protein